MNDLMKRPELFFLICFAGNAQTFYFIITFLKFRSKAGRAEKNTTRFTGIRYIDDFMLGELK